MMKNIGYEKINPSWASRKGFKPTWGTLEESRWHWRKIFYIEGKRYGKIEAKRTRRWSRDTIRHL